jgi:hypothetical protein
MAPRSGRTCWLADMQGSRDVIDRSETPVADGSLIAPAAI